MKPKVVLRKAANALIKRELSGWPPECFGFTYQPVRPKQRKDTGKKKT